MKVLLVDPDGGWRYGFPKPVPEEFYTLGDDFDFQAWLVSEGYPKHMVDYWLNSSFGHVPCRFWEKETEVE